MAKRKIFLSYLRVNKVEVLKLYKKLSDAGFAPWMDVKDIRPGQTWPVTTKRAIDTSDFFLACLTKGSVDSEGFFKQELAWALDNKKKRESGIYLIPVRLEDCETPTSLKKLQWLNLYERGGWDRLLETLQVSASPTDVTLIEFEITGSLAYFDEEEFKAALRDVVGADIKRIRITGIRAGSIKVTIEGDGEELTRILESLRDSKELQQKFSMRTQLTSVSYIQNGQQHTFRARRRLIEVPSGLGIVVGFVAGVLGNLLADLIRQGWFSNPFMPPQLIVTVLTTLASLGASVWAARQPLSLPGLSRFLPKHLPGHQLLANVMAFVLLAALATTVLSLGLREWLVRTRDCDGVRVEALEFRLTARQLQYSGSDITLRHQDLNDRQNLAGRAVLSDLRDGEECMCEWWGGVNKLTQQQLPPRSEAKDCIFSIPFQDDVREINLKLKVGRRAGTSGFEPVNSFDFKIKVQ
jgi:hypothetical protein